MMFNSIEEIKRANKIYGDHWFDRDAIRFFNSRVGGRLLRDELTKRTYFVSSERQDDDSERRYTIRYADEVGHIHTQERFMQFESSRAAWKFLRDHLQPGREWKWIVYLSHPMGGFYVERAKSLSEAERLLISFSRNVFMCEQASALLYPYSEEDWREAREYAEIDCPLDYPSKVMEFGPRGGVKVSNA